MTTLADLKLYATQPHKCSYLENKEATTIFIDPGTSINGQLYTQLSDLGFRRSGPHVYKPNCANCNACIPVRIPVNAFSITRRQKRINNKNKDLRIEITHELTLEKHYPLYERYISQRHADGDMYPPSHEQFSSFLTNEWNITNFFNFYLDDKLAAVAVTDVLENGLSAIYTFFEPELDSRSLGVYSILWQIEYAKQLNLPYLYLGYWIKDCRKMNYKTEYRPLEVLINNHWAFLS